MADTIDLDKLLISINCLGETEDEIAGKLHEMNIVGEPDDTENCVMAEYLKREYEGVDVRVEHAVIRVNGITLVEADLPAHIWKFIERFDQNYYDYLVDEDCEWYQNKIEEEAEEEYLDDHGEAEEDEEDEDEEDEDDEDEEEVEVTVPCPLH